LVHTWSERQAFIDECEALEATLASAVDQPDAATRAGIGEWSLPRLVGHLVGVAQRVGQRPTLPAPEQQRAEINRVGFYVRHMATVESGTYRPIDEPALPDPATWSEQLGQAWHDSDAVLGDTDPDALVSTTHGAMAVREYVATRVVEVCVHHLDVRVALDRPPEATPTAGQLTQDLLERLLAGPRPRNLGRTRFIRAATGRGGYDDPRFPVLV
jgi:hypothetical protein